MATYHVGCGIAAIYAGTLNKKGTMWTNKSDVTHEAISAVAQFLLDQNESVKFTYNDKNYILTVAEDKK